MHIADNADFTPVTMTIRFLAGIISSTVVLSTKEDLVAEPVEEFSARLSNPSQGDIGPNDTASVFINDNDGIEYSAVSLCLSSLSHKSHHLNS